MYISKHSLTGIVLYWARSPTELWSRRFTLTFGDNWTDVLQTRSPSWHPATGVKILMGNINFINITCSLVCIQKCRESSSNAGADCSSEQSVNDVTLTARLKEVDLSCQLNECKEKLLITEQQVHNWAFWSSRHTGLVITYIHTYIQRNLYSAKFVETNQRRWHRVTRQ